MSTRTSTDAAEGARERSQHRTGPDPNMLAHVRAITIAKCSLDERNRSAAQNRAAVYHVGKAPIDGTERYASLSPFPCVAHCCISSSFPFPLEFPFSARVISTVRSLRLSSIARSPLTLSAPRLDATRCTHTALWRDAAATQIFHHPTLQL